MTGLELIGRLTELGQEALSKEVWVECGDRSGVMHDGTDVEVAHKVDCVLISSSGL